MNVLISPIRAVLDQLDDQRVGYILCTSSERLKDLKQKQNVLVLRFMDVADGSHQGAFQREQAGSVCQFLYRASRFEDLFICCDSGTSRSAAIAAATLLWQDRSDLSIWRDPEYRPNPHVFKLQCEAFGVDICDDEISMRVDLNDAALPSAIQNRYKNYPPHVLYQFKSKKRSKNGKGVVIRRSVQHVYLQGGKEENIAWSSSEDHWINEAK